MRSSKTNRTIDRKLEPQIICALRKKGSNPVRGWLFIEEHAPNYSFLFFGGAGWSASTHASIRERIAGFANFCISRRRKTKREMCGSAIVAINRQPLTGLLATTIQGLRLFRDANEWVMPNALARWTTRTASLFQLVDTQKKVKFTNALLAPDSRIS